MILVKAAPDRKGHLALRVKKLETQIFSTPIPCIIAGHLFPYSKTCFVLCSYLVRIP
jgi:hypothetical protein